ncbi:MAG TPA: hypothetical protein VFQ85_08680 [Mycobacteriales bacterium]|jgi:hypothetical protein|nr:hypothetical protein [Mycobacteriales bacterium]
MRRRTLAIALVLLCGIAVPANATYNHPCGGNVDHDCTYGSKNCDTYIHLGHWVACREPSGAYVSDGGCDLIEAGDPTGVINQDPRTRYGVLGGEWTAADAGAGVLLHCTVQLSDAAMVVDSDRDGRPDGPATDHDSSAVASCHGEGTGAAVASCAVEFAADTTADLYVCSYAQVHYAGHSEFYAVDSDGNGANGVQCELVVSAV